MNEPPGYKLGKIAYHFARFILHNSFHAAPAKIFKKVHIMSFFGTFCAPFGSYNGLLRCTGRFPGFERRKGAFNLSQFFLAHLGISHIPHI
jgi:hypothetical protein